MMKKMGYYIGQVVSFALMLLFLGGALAIIKVAVYLLRWVICGTFVI